MHMSTQKSMLSFVNKESMIIALAVFLLISTVSFLYAQNNTPTNNTAQPAQPAQPKYDANYWLNLLVNETIPIVASFLSLGIAAIVQWMRSRGIPISDQQEAMFRNIVTERFTKLAKDSWSTMRDNPEKLDIYWNELRQGHVPKDFQEKLRTEGYDFAIQLK